MTIDGKDYEQRTAGERPSLLIQPIKKNGMNITGYIHRRRVCRLAERILSNQIAYGNYDNRVESVRNAISTAEQFYHEWEKGGTV